MEPLTVSVGYLWVMVAVAFVVGIVIGLSFAGGDDEGCAP